MMPHDPHTPPERLLARYRELAPSEHVAKYWAMIEWFDETVGQLLDHLDTQGLTKNTVVVYLADNGWIQNVDAPRYAPKSKQSPYDGGVRTPILLRWPKMMPWKEGTLASSIDIVPTILHIVGQQPTPQMQGISLLKARGAERRQLVTGECFTHNAVDLDNPAANLRWRWIVEGQWKLIVPDPVNERGAKPELYRIVTDPREEQDLASQQPERVEQLRKQLDDWWNPAVR